MMQRTKESPLQYSTASILLPINIIYHLYTVRISHLLDEFVSEPVQGLVDPRPLDSRATLQAPAVVPDLVQTVLTADLLLLHGPLHVLLVGQDKDRHIFQVLHGFTATSLMTTLNSSVLAIT